MKNSINFYLIIFLMFFCVNNLFSAINKKNGSYNVKKSTVTIKQNQRNKDLNSSVDKKDNIEELLQKEQNSVAYLVLESKKAPAQYKVTGNIEKDQKINRKKKDNKNNNDKRIFITGAENDVVVNDKNRYSVTGLETGKTYKSVLNKKNDSKTKNKNVKKRMTYNLTGAENRFNLTYAERQKIYNINGTEEVNKSLKKLTLTKFQKDQLNNIEMEKKYKLLALDKEIASRKKSLNEELSKEYFDVYFINKLSDEIKQLVVDKETVTINTDKKIRYVLTPQQYIEYKAQQSKKKKFLLFNKH